MNSARAITRPKTSQHFNAEDKEQQMQDELASELPNTDAGPYMSASYFRTTTGASRARCAGGAGIRSSFFTPGRRQDKASLDIIAIMTSLKAAVSSVRETVFKLSLDTSQEVRRKNVQYSTGFLLVPGSIHFKFVVGKTRADG